MYEKEEKVDDMEMPPEIGGESDQPASELPDTEPTESEGSGDSDDIKMTDQQPSSSGNYDDEPEVMTADALQEKIESLVDSGAIDNVYVEVPKVNLDAVIAKNDEVHYEIDRYFNRTWMITKSTLLSSIRCTICFRKSAEVMSPFIRAYNSKHLTCL